MSYMKDDNNDWLSQEKAREGYKRGKTSAEIDHQIEENSSDWKAGAIFNAKEHYDAHPKLHEEEQPFEHKSENFNTFSNRTNKSKVSSEDFQYFLINFASVFILAFINSTLNLFVGRYSMIPVIFLFLTINPGIFIWLGLFKRFPPALYSKVSLGITLTLYLILTVINQGLF